MRAAGFGDATKAGEPVRDDGRAQREKRLVRIFTRRRAEPPAQFKRREEVHELACVMRNIEFHCGLIGPKAYSKAVALSF